MALTDISLCSRALIKLGAQPIASFVSGSAEADIADALYSVTRDALLTAYPWSFATAQVALSASSTPPVADYQYAYDLPADFLRAISVGSTSKARGARYRIIGGTLHCDQDAPVLSYIFRPGEADFPPFFDALLIARLSAEFCLPLTENASRAELLFRQSEDELKKARGIDAQQDTPQRLDQFSLIDARG